MTKGTKKPGAGPSSRLTKQQILRVVRRHFEDKETIISLAKALNVSSSYLSRVVKEATGPEGWIRIRVETDLDDQAVNTAAVLSTSGGQLALTVDGKQVAIVIDASTATAPQFQRVIIGDTIIEISVTR